MLIVPLLCSSASSQNHAEKYIFDSPTTSIIPQHPLDLTTTVRSNSTALHLLQFLFELLDRGMCALEVLVETVSLTDELLLPLSEPLFLDLDLLGESLSKCLLFLLEFRVVQLSWSCLAKFSSLHLLCSVCLVVSLFRSVDEIKHVCSDQDRSQVLEVAVVLVLDFRNTPRVLSAFHDAAVGRLDILLAADDGEGHSLHELLRVLSGSLVILLDWRLVDLDALCLDDVPDAVLEAGEVGRGERISFGDDWDQVDSRAQAFHDFNVQRLQSVTCRTDEVKADVNAEIDLVHTARLLLLEHI
jgi:hypothetical protein